MSELRKKVRRATMTGNPMSGNWERALSGLWSYTRGKTAMAIQLTWVLPAPGRAFIVADADNI